MKSPLFLSTYFAASTLALPTFFARDATFQSSQATTLTIRVSNLEAPSAIKSATTQLTVNNGALRFDTCSALVSAGPSGLNIGGHVYATRVDIILPGPSSSSSSSSSATAKQSMNNVHCNLYNEEMHVIAELSGENLGADFDGVEGNANDRAVNADGYSLLCYFV